MTIQKLSEPTVRRLILVRQMYMLAAQHAADPSEIGRVVAIQTYDYVIEMLLKTVISHFGSPLDYAPPQSGYYHKITSLKNPPYKPRADFYRVWDEVIGIFRAPTNQITATDLPLRREIGLLHDMRNDVQHHGIVPALDEVRKYTVYAESFIRDVSTAAFGREIEEIYMASLIVNKTIRRLFVEAEVAYRFDQYDEAIIAAAKAFQIAARKQARRRPYRRHLSRWVIGEIERELRSDKISYSLRDYARSAGGDSRQQGELEKVGKKLEKTFGIIGRILKEAVQEMDELRESLDIVTLGADLRRYRRFRMLSPHLTRTYSGEWQVNTPEDWKPLKGEAIEVLSFVFDSILRGQGISLEQEEE